jgi:hypothetical protein
MGWGWGMTCMTESQFKDFYNKASEEHLKFERVQNKRSQRPDLHAFLLLDELCPSDKDIICHARHDEIFLSVEVEDLIKVVTEDQVIELIRCGVRYSDDSLCMFV